MSLTNFPNLNSVPKTLHSLSNLSIYHPSPLPPFPSLPIPPPRNRSHTMNLRIPGPLPKRLSKVPKHNPTQTPQGNKTHIRHDGRDISILDDPRRDEFAEAVAPDILIDRDGDED